MRQRYMQKIFLLCMVLTTGLLLRAQEPTDVELKGMLAQNMGRLPITAPDVDDAIVNSSFEDKSTGIRYIYLQQGYQSIGVFNQVITIAMRNGKVVFVSGKFIPNLAAKVPSSTPAIAAADAVQKTASVLSLKPPTLLKTVSNTLAVDKKISFDAAGIAKRNIESKLEWVVDDDGQKVHLAWDVSIDVLGSPDWWNVRIDALTGEYVNKNNYTLYELPNRVDDKNNNTTWKAPKLPLPNTNKTAQRGNNGTGAPLIVPQAQATTTATYRVVPFPTESPYTGLGLVTNPWEKAGTNNPATTYFWHYDGTDYDSTRGNNVHAYIDAANLNNDLKPNFSARSTTGQPSLNFNFTPNFNVQPQDTTDRLVALTNLFYWNNLMHDVTYQYGFNEVSGNFQNTNTFNGVNRGGTGGDYVRAEAQDGSGTDNANFSTPADGSSGRMQMYLWAGPTNFNITAPAAIAGNYFAKESGFSTANKLKNLGTLTGQVVYYNDNPADTSHYACGAGGTGVPANPVTGKIALIVRGGGCAGGFVEKVKNAQLNGAIGVIMINNVAGLPITMGGTDNTITIPAIMLSNTDGALLGAQTLISPVTVTMTAGPDRDGDLDNGVMCHEYTHGISNRLTGGRTNASCLANAEQGGEGWSDYLALMMTTDWTTATVNDGSKLRPVGNYAEAYPIDGPGLRTYVYTTNMLANPHTYADVATNTEVHYIGEVWCSAIWDMTWYIIQQENRISPNLYDTTGTSGTAGNIIALKLVMEGMRLQTCRPGFLDARDAILAADSILYGSRHKCSIWNAFARRGMGVSAQEGSSNSATDQVAAFDIPGGFLLGRAIVPPTVPSGNNATITISATCQCQVPAQGYIRDTIPAGFTLVSSSPAGTLSGNVLSISPIDFFSTVNETKTISIVMKATMTGCDTLVSINDNRDSTTVGGLTSSALVGTTQWAVSNSHSKSPSTSWYAADVAGLRDFELTSAPFTVGSLSVLSFWQYYVLETTLDGGRVEYSTDGTTWLDASPYILQNGYNTTMISTSPWGAGVRTFSGSSYAEGSNQFINTLINFSTFTGQTLRVRFRLQTNSTNASSQTYEGWFIDDIKLTNGCGAYSGIGLYNSLNNRVDSMMYPIFVTRGTSLPLTLLSFTATPASSSVLLGWQTAAELNTSSFVVEHSTDGASWSSIGTVAAQGSGSASYTFYDQQPATGLNYYRLKMVDKDGSYSYSGVKVVNFTASGANLFTIVPNPANSIATLYLDRTINSGKITVFDANGRAVQSFTVTNVANGYRLETGKLSAGTYLVSITNGTTTAVGKLVVAH